MHLTLPLEWPRFVLGAMAKLGHLYEWWNRVVRNWYSRANSREHKQLP